MISNLPTKRVGNVHKKITAWEQYVEWMHYDLQKFNLDRMIEFGFKEGVEWMQVSKVDGTMVFYKKGDSLFYRLCDGNYLEIDSKTYKVCWDGI